MIIKGSGNFERGPVNSLCKKIGMISQQVSRPEKRDEEISILRHTLLAHILMCASLFLLDVTKTAISPAKKDMTP